MSEETKKVHYTGRSPIEIRVGEFHRKFRPDQVAEVKEDRFRMDLLDRPDFKATELEVRAGKTKSSSAKKKADDAPAAPEYHEPAHEEAATEDMADEAGANDEAEEPGETTEVDING